MLFAPTIFGLLLIVVIFGATVIVIIYCICKITNAIRYSKKNHILQKEVSSRKKIFQILEPQFDCKDEKNASGSLLRAPYSGSNFH